jgi:hypothetical protein
VEQDHQVGLAHRLDSISPDLIGEVQRLAAAVPAAAVSATFSLTSLAAALLKKRSHQSLNQKGVDIKMPLALSFEEAIKGSPQTSLSIVLNRFTL